MGKKEFKANQVINGTFGEIWLDGEYIGQITAAKAELTAKTQQIEQCGTLVNGEKITGLEQKGELKMHKTTSMMIKKLAPKFQKGQMPECSIISKLADPDALGAERIALYGVTFDKATLLDWEAGKVGEETYSFNFRDFKLLDLID